MSKRFFETYISVVRKVLPSPYTIAVLLTIIVLLGVFTFGNFNELSSSEILDSWASGLWEPNLMVFAMQMMLILVLGNVLALSPVVEKIIQKLVIPCTNSANSAALISLTAMLVGLFNWGLGLVFGAILARKVGKKAKFENRKLNYGLIGAAGYSALLIWHGGISGSSLIKVAESGHLNSLTDGKYSSIIPDSISLNETVFSSLNIWVSIALLIVVPAVLYGIGKLTEGEVPAFTRAHDTTVESEQLIGAEKLDHSGIFSKSIGIGVLFYCFYLMYAKGGVLSFFTPNNINFLLLGLCLLSHKHIVGFIGATDNAIRGASGILIQFPLYFGILALMQSSGLIEAFSNFIIDHSSPLSFPLFTFFSAGLVNLFVPSGGGQWAIQGPIIIQSSLELGIPLNKSILALAYGDEVTNMLQPFWALPLLGITQLSARDILPYTLVMFLTASSIFILGLLSI